MLHIARTTRLGTQLIVRHDPIAGRDVRYFLEKKGYIKVYRGAIPLGNEQYRASKRQFHSASKAIAYSERFRMRYIALKMATEQAFTPKNEPEG